MKLIFDQILVLIFQATLPSFSLWAYSGYIADMGLREPVES